MNEVVHQVLGLLWHLLEALLQVTIRFLERLLEEDEELFDALITPAAELAVRKGWL